MNPVRSIFCALALVLAGPVAAQDQAAQREPTMKEVGGGFSVINKMNRSQSPYDAAAAKAAFEKIAAAATKFATLFEGPPSPAGKALPAIWENKADFDARLTKLAADATAGAATTDEAAFKAAFATVGGQCGSCHDKYRGD
jgi:cytochrome c556